MACRVAWIQAMRRRPQYAASKRMMRMGLDEGFNDHVHHVFLQLLPLLRTEDAKEGMRAFMEQRPAKFEGR